MSQLNGTDVLVYADGTLIAAQTDVTINVDQDLIPTTNKSSGGWAEHINGARSGSVDCDAFYSTTGVSAEDLFTYITGKTSLLLVVNVNNVPVVCEANVASSSITAPVEGATTLSATFNCTDGIWILTGTFAELFEDWNNGDYDTFTTASTVISSAINASGSAYGYSDDVSLTDGDVVKVFTFLTLNSGEAPYVQFTASAGGAAVSNQEQLAAGANFVTLTATATDATSQLEISNTGASNFSTSSIYVFKTA